jgi:hypothetical protein
MNLDKSISPEEFYSMRDDEKRDYKRGLNSEENLIFTTNLAEWNIKNSFGINVDIHEKWMLRLYLKRFRGDPKIWDFFQRGISELLSNYFGIDFSDFFPKEEGMFRYPETKDYLSEKSEFWRNERKLI